MTEKKTDNLFKKYASIFPPADVRKDPTKSCLAFGIECGDGWYNIIEEVCKELSLIGNVTIEQIKEKLGGLRIYVDGGNDQTHTIIEYAERAASKTCEQCGASKKEGPVRQGGWLYAFCDDCMSKEKERRSDLGLDSDEDEDL